MATWGSRGLRGSTFEDMINRSNEKYLNGGLAVIQKIPTPITPMKMDPNNKQITLAFFDKKSTVDYIGAVQGIPICFDAKESAVDTFSLQNVHQHQIDFMEAFEQQGGVSFFLLYYSHKDEIYYLPFKKMLEFWKRSEEGGRKSFRFEEIDISMRVVPRRGILVPYLDMLQKDLQGRDA